MVLIGKDFTNNPSERHKVVNLKSGNSEFKASIVVMLTKSKSVDQAVGMGLVCKINATVEEVMT